MAPTPGVTVVRSNPAQDKVLRFRGSVLQTVAGATATGKTQSIINLITSAVGDGQTVLFVSKNNTAGDNVVDAFRKEQLFPGILRLGNQDVRKASADYFRQVLTTLDQGVPVPANPAHFAARGLALIREIASLEEELADVERLKATATELSVLRRRTDEHLRETGLYRFATDLAEQITTTIAARSRPSSWSGCAASPPAQPTGRSRPAASGCGSWPGLAS